MTYSQFPDTRALPSFISVNHFITHMFKLAMVRNLNVTRLKLNTLIKPSIIRTWEYVSKNYYF